MPEGANIESNFVSVLISSSLGSYGALAPPEGPGTPIKRSGIKKTSHPGELHLESRTHPLGSLPHEQLMVAPAAFFACIAVTSRSATSFLPTRNWGKLSFLGVGCPSHARFCPRNSFIKICVKYAQQKRHNNKVWRGSIIHELFLCNYLVWWGGTHMINKDLDVRERERERERSAPRNRIGLT